MRRRTLIGAWCFIVIWSVTTVPTTMELLAIPRPPAIQAVFVWHVVLSVALVLSWASLLRRQAWSWWALIALSGYAILNNAMDVAVVLARYGRWDTALVLSAQALILGALPLCLLLTDRPTGWSSSSEEQPLGLQPR